MKHKVGDRVRIRSREWIDAQEESTPGCIVAPEGYGCYLSEGMYDYAGRTAKIVELDIIVNCYRLEVDNGRFVWEDWMFDPEYEADGEAADGGEDKPLPAEDAIRAMLDGDTLVDLEGYQYFFDRELEAFYYRDPGNLTAPQLLTCFTGFYRRPARRKRAMNRFEILAWAGGEESRGWVVRLVESHPCQWNVPQFHSYELHKSYQRARLLPDGSGIDEESICGFEVEE